MNKKVYLFFVCFSQIILSSDELNNRKEYPKIDLGLALELNRAVFVGNLRKVQELLLQGAKPNVRWCGMGSSTSALHVASAYGYTKIKEAFKSANNGEPYDTIFLVNDLKDVEIIGTERWSEHF